jgi:hypothetical protein
MLDFLDSEQSFQIWKPGINEGTRLCKIEKGENEYKSKYIDLFFGKRKPNSTEVYTELRNLRVRLPFSSKPSISAYPTGLFFRFVKNFGDLFGLDSKEIIKKTLIDLGYDENVRDILEVLPYNDHALLQDQLMQIFEALENEMYKDLEHVKNMYGFLVLGYTPRTKYLLVPPQFEGKSPWIPFFLNEQDAIIQESDKWSLTVFPTEAVEENPEVKEEVKEETKEEDNTLPF